MKRFLIALLVGGAVFAAVFGAAASLTISPAYMQAGLTTDLACDPDTVRVNAWGFELDDLLVDYVKIGGVHSNCNGLRMYGAVYDNVGGQLGGNACTIVNAPSGDDNEVKLTFGKDNCADPPTGVLNPAYAPDVEELHIGMHP